MNSNPSNLNKAENQICGIFGTGRSGSTWLGSILNSHPEVAYRFEPFHRLRDRSDLISALTRGESEGLSDKGLEQVYSALIQADPVIEKPPFFHKDNIKLGRNLFWPIARKLRFASHLFSLRYTPRDRPPLVFKEVDLDSMMASMLHHTTIPIVYLIRNPFGVISSLLEGQARNLMGKGRMGVLASLMRNHDSALADRYTGELPNLSPAQLNALLWRIDVEKAWRCMSENQKGLLLFYEDLCKNTVERAREVFRHFDIDYVGQVEEFILKSTRSSQNLPSRLNEITQNSYFSVYRDPLESMNKWKDRLSKVDRDAIASILSGSEAIEFYFSHGHWEI